MFDCERKKDDVEWTMKKKAKDGRFGLEIPTQQGSNRSDTAVNDKKKNKKPPFAKNWKW